MSNLFFTIIASLSFFISCKSPETELNYEVPTFPTEKVANVQKLNKNTIFSSPSHLFKWQDYLIIQSRSVDNNNVFQLIYTRTGEHITGFGFIGRGDGELLDFMTPFMDSKKSRICAVDNTGKLVSFNLNTVIKDDNTTHIEESYKMVSHLSASQLFAVGNNLLHPAGLKDDCGRLFTTNRFGLDTVYLTNMYPSKLPIIKGDSSSKFYFRYNSHYAIKPDGSKLCAISGNGMILEIWDMKNTPVKHSALRYFYEPKMNSYVANNPKVESIRGAYCIAATDRYIYCGYYDVDSRNEYACPKLAVFDWDGDEVNCYTFEKDIFGRFTVDENDMRVYCWIHTIDGDGYLGYFDLNLP